MKKHLRAFLCGLILAAAVALPAFAAEYGEPDITPSMTMGEIRSNPSIIGAGIYTYSLDQDRALDRLYWNTQTLNRLSNRWTAQDSADGLNYLIRQYNAGLQVTYPLYTADEIAQEPGRDGVELYYLPAEGEQAHNKYVLVIGGNAILVSAELREGVSTAWNLHEMGYPTFVLRYRIGTAAGNNAPLEDVTRAVQYITEHAEQFGVQAEDYAIVAYSSGAQIAGQFASDAYGYAHYGLPRPGAMLFGYPVNNFNITKPVYHVMLDGGTCEQRYYDRTIAELITPDYPPTYHWCGRNDLSLTSLNWAAQCPALEKALERNGVPHIYHVYRDAPHAVAAGKGTDAEGWLTEAVTFWEEQTRTDQ